MVRAAAGELDGGSEQCIAHCLADENFARLGESSDAGADVYREAHVVVAVLFDFAEVQAGSDLEAEARGLGPDLTRDIDRGRRTRDDREEAVAQGVYFHARRSG